MSFAWLPSVLAEIAEVAGLDAALKIAEKRGGTEIYIPASAGEDHWLVATVGREAADAICRHFSTGHGGVSVILPLGPGGSLATIRRTADRMIAEGRTIAEIALAVGYTARAVERRKAKLKGRDDRQGKLF
jgi:hypothetical protein